MTTYEIPLTPQPQSFNIVLAGITYGMVLKWNNDPACNDWVLDIYDSSGDLIIGGIPLVTGVNLLEQYDYLNFGGALEVQTDHDTYAIPTFTNLGIDSHLYFITTP